MSEQPQTFAFVLGTHALGASFLKQKKYVCHAPAKSRVARRRLIPTAQTAHPSLPNKDVDWIFVDTVVKTQEFIVSEKLQREIQDDALSLVRVALRDAPTELCVVLCDDQEISQLNSRWRGIDTTTDVLSFPQNDPDKVVLGDIVISVETAVKQADERNYDVRNELRVLLVHGLLHLMGYDHEGVIEGDWLVMAKMENMFLTQLGWQGEGLISSVQQDSTYRDIAQS
ncbi:unnamed protein product [Agarophyton chilense]